MCCLRRDIKQYEWRPLGGNLTFVRAVANQARKIYSYGGREEVLQLRAHDGAREVVREGGQIFSDAKEALKK